MRQIKWPEGLIIVYLRSFIAIDALLVTSDILHAGDPLLHGQLVLDIGNALQRLVHRFVESVDNVVQLVDPFLSLADNALHILHLVVQCGLFRGCKLTIAVAVACDQLRLNVLIDLLKKLLDLYKLISKLCEICFNFQ